MIKRNSTLVSICMPVFNEERYIQETLDSLLNQTYKNFEVLISDNASTDATFNLCSRYCESDTRFKIHSHLVNIGQVNNFSRCYTRANGDLVLMLSGNDVLASNYIETVVDVHNAEPDTGIVYSRIIKIDESSSQIRKLDDRHYFNTDFDDIQNAYVTLLKNFKDPGSFFGTFKREVLEKLQLMRHVYGSDQIFIGEASLYGNIRCVDEYLFLSRSHERKALPEVYSEYHSRGMPGKSILRKLDVLTPIICLINGHADMVSKAIVPASIKLKLISFARKICRERGGSRLLKERDSLLNYAEDVLDPKKITDNPGMVSQFRRLYLGKHLQQALFVFPRDKAIRAILSRINKTHDSIDS